MLIERELDVIEISKNFIFNCFFPSKNSKLSQKAKIDLNLLSSIKVQTSCD
ncbi:hypothetical protein LEP1GSC074_4236 [Leptospira noguchii str. Hook]|uniref:Uncharacterized protein n=1 Tax=Leptospira noguchii serovar Autumnalis str. ZUN142 TaxID=1085540 RepID=M6V0S0_9LEPT|nr:hypothetical protein LEP1GSC041_1873 [Leptospira noguchii str. 2006001870]EMO28645.1 hypothetical protein LEP1GSC170_6171 [Leptospira interrogans serovar Bataviae str. HAI135]EMO43148.1 hypothetical protein LEP1GSC186_2419 [Leptospira noguchii serovar Autumnalis str. ZUN142]EMS85957.1 hypothetical protein LEP1GSC074_4236 [Leptospira noguchii str. Hook]